jgi:PhzF family phenazine biosynthesis protein
MPQHKHKRRIEMPVTIYQVDAFTNKAFRGNPAGVCILKQPGNETWMQLVAREMNLSETAFLYKTEDGYNLRWFTPQTEVDLCGHATLASAHILFETGLLPAGQAARFHTASGLLTARKQDDYIEMDFPAKPVEAIEAPRGMAEALFADLVFVGKNKFDYLAEIETDETIRCMEPNLDQLKTLGMRGVMVTSRSADPEFDFISRFFAPGVGINEDPVTGSAHCCLGPYWAEKLGKSEMVAYQASPRGGIVHVRVAGERVFLKGQAITVFKAEMLAR